MPESKLLSTEVNVSSLATPFFDLPNNEKMTIAAEVANILGAFIEKQKLYSEFSGKKHINIEGWSTLGTILNLYPVEEYVKELEDGSFEAKVKLIDMNGVQRGEGSGYCGVDESNWKNKPKFARRSMAITRAAGKAYRFTLSWIPKMQGYEGTPAEEMDFLDTTAADVPRETLHQTALRVAGELRDPNMRHNALVYIEENKDNEEDLRKIINRMKEAVR